MTATPTTTLLVVLILITALLLFVLTFIIQREPYKSRWEALVDAIRFWI
jgi:hypothetical protein